MCRVTKTFPRMKKYALIIVVVILALYLNRSYAHIYSTIDDAHLVSPDSVYSYQVGKKGTAKSITYVAIGDSLTAGVGVDEYQKSFPYLVAEKMSAKVSTMGTIVHLKDRAYPGFKTRDVKGALLDEAIKDNPDVITLLIGVNDIHGNISKKVFKANYQNILKRLTSETKAKVYVIGLPYLGTNTLLLPPYRTYFKLRTDEFNEVIKDITAEYGVTYIELPSSDSYSADSFHPSAEGYATWAETIYARIN